MCFAIQGSILILVVILMLSNQDECEWQIIIVIHQKNYDEKLSNWYRHNMLHQYQNISITIIMSMVKVRLAVPFYGNIHHSSTETALLSVLNLYLSFKSSIC